MLQDVLSQVETGHSWKNTIQVCVCMRLQLLGLMPMPYTVRTVLP